MPITLSEIAAEIGVSLSQIEEACREYALPTVTIQGEEIIASYRGVDTLRAAFSPSRFRSKLLAFAGHYGDYIQGRNPQLEEYMCFHNTLDVLCWLLKLRYSPRERVKARAYRLDTLFDDFLTEQRYDIKAVQRLVGERHSTERLIFHLKKVGITNLSARSL